MLSWNELEKILEVGFHLNCCLRSYVEEDIEFPPLTPFRA